MADFKDAAKSNFKQAAVVFIVDVIVYIVFFRLTYFIVGRAARWRTSIIAAHYFAYIYYDAYVYIPTNGDL